MKSVLDNRQTANLTLVKREQAGVNLTFQLGCNRPKSRVYSHWANCNDHI